MKAKIATQVLVIFALVNTSIGQVLESQRNATKYQDQSRTEAFRGIGKLINRHRSVWLDVFDWPLYGKSVYDVWLTGGITRDRRDDRGTPSKWRSVSIGMTVYWDHLTGVYFHRDTAGTLVIEPKTDSQGTKEIARDDTDPAPRQINFWVDRGNPLTLNEAKEIAAYCGLQYDANLQEFFDDSGKMSGRYDGGLQIDIER